jgi:hypothetical protein
MPARTVGGAHGMIGVGISAREAELELR